MAGESWDLKTCTAVEKNEKDEMVYSLGKVK